MWPTGHLSESVVSDIGHRVGGGRRDWPGTMTVVYEAATTPDRARMSNMVCWAYGADPEDTGDVVAAGLLAEGRADGCDDEFQKLDRAWSTLLDPYEK